MTTPTADRVVARPGADTKAKRAAKVADRIVEDVTCLGWPVGEVLGSEAELLERYRVSRAVFREAVRLVEHQQVARTRRGPGGGLVITEPTVGAVTDAVVLYLHRVEARLDEIFEARIVLEEIACGLACGADHEARDRVELRRLVDDSGRRTRRWPPRPPCARRRPSAATRVSSCSSTSSAGWRRSTHRTGNASATPRPGRRGTPTSMIAQAVMAGDGGWPAPVCARTSRPRPTSSSAAAPPVSSFPTSVVLARVERRQGRRDRGAQHHPDHRGGRICSRGIWLGPSPS